MDRHNWQMANQIGTVIYECVIKEAKSILLQFRKKEKISSVPICFVCYKTWKSPFLNFSQNYKFGLLLHINQCLNILCFKYVLGKIQIDIVIPSFEVNHLVCQ